MKYLFLFLLFFIVLVIGIIIFFSFPETVEEYTGIQRGELPLEITKKLSFLDFTRLKETGKYQIYHYKVESSNEKKLVLVVTEKEDLVFDEDVNLPYPTYSNGNTKISKVCVEEGEPDKQIKVICINSSKPKAYVGTLHHENDNQE